MKTSDKAERRAGQLERALEKLFYDEQFISQIKKLRTEVDIPADGYKKFDDYFAYLKKDLDNANNWFIKIEPRVYGLAKEHGLTSNYAFWIEAFLAMGFNYRKFEQRTPRNHPRQNIINGRGVALDVQHESDDHILLKIFAGASVNEVVSFVRENREYIKNTLDSRVIHGKAPDLRNVGNRNRSEILKLADAGLIDSTGRYVGKDERPDCLMKNGKPLSMKQTKNIITGERRKRKLSQ